MNIKARNYIYYYDELGNEFVETVLTNGTVNVSISIERKRYEFWLLMSNKLCWKTCKNENADGVYRAEEVEGVSDFHEYWRQDSNIILSHLKEYILEQKTTYFITKLNKLS